MTTKSSVVSAVNSKDMIETNKPKNDEKSKKSHPSTATMVHAAISTLNDRQGSSIPSIMKFIESNYQVDIQKLKVHMKKYMKNAVAQELLVQTKGHGFTGSFKLPSKSKKVKSDPTKVETKLPNKQTVPESVKIPKTDTTTKKLKKSLKTTPTKMNTVETKVKATKKSQKKVSVLKEVGVIKKPIPLTPENVNDNLKSSSKTKKIRSPVAKKTPRPKRITRTKATN
ncbi:histone H1B, sperm-like [Chelonus insularis]|uniref:histone H1B, sperm-like n=1 Tax=Chelonus insularis TaxID=460826 RepID=UPI00158BCB82|nr:histone H1B, sperm-like [Chelonus insularis]